jgi:hypothetical protein
MGISGRKAGGLGIGLLAYFVIRKPSRQERRRVLREAIYASYEQAAADPDFMAEHWETTRDLDRTAGDGLQPIPPAS